MIIIITTHPPIVPPIAPLKGDIDISTVVTTLVAMGDASVVDDTSVLVMKNLSNSRDRFSDGPVGIVEPTVGIPAET